MNDRTSGRGGKILLALAACQFLSGCGLIAAPFRVAGAVVDTAYVGGKKVAKSTSDALEKRKQRKQREEEEAAKADARGKTEAGKTAGQKGAVPPTDSIPVDQAPAIPVDGQPLPPVEPLPLPQ